MGLDYNNSRTFIDVKGTTDKLNYIQVLPGVYTFTGCNYTPAFFRKGKIMLKSDLFTNTFNKMGEDLIDKDIDVLESFHALCLVTANYYLLMRQYIYILRVSANQKKQQRH